MSEQCTFGVKTVTKTERTLDATANKMCCGKMRSFADHCIDINVESVMPEVIMHIVDNTGTYEDYAISHCPFCGAEIIFVNTSPMTLEDLLSPLYQPGIQPQGTYTWSDDNIDISTEEKNNERKPKSNHP